MAVQHQGYSGVVAEVDVHRQAAVVLNSDMSKAGYAMIGCRNDDGAVSGVTDDRNPEADADYRARVAVETLLFHESFAGAALNSSQWSSNVTTMATAVAGGYLKLNSASNAAASTVARVTSYRTIPIFQPFPTYLDFPVQIAAASVGIANTTIEVGLFIATGTAAPTDGVFVRINASGEMRLVCSFGGVETQSGLIDYTATIAAWGAELLPVNADRHFVLGFTAHDIELWIDDVLVTKLEQPAGIPSFATAQQLPISYRIYHGATPPASATQLWIGTVTVSCSGLANAPSFAEVVALQGGGGYQGQSGGTMGQTCNWTNSTEPANATLSNTTPGYTTLGGQWSFAAPAGAVTDFVLFSYTVPAAAAGSHNKNMLVKYLRIDAVNVGAAVATTATVLQWAIAVGATADSLATAEGATTKAPRRIVVGIQSWVVGAAIGAPVESISLDFSKAPLLAEPGTRIQIIVRVPIGTATASQVIRGTCAIIGQHC